MDIMNNEDKLNYLNKMQEILMNIATKYINIPFEQVTRTIEQSLGELGEFVGADRTYIFEYDWDNNVCNNTHEWCEDGIIPHIEILQNINLELIPQWVKCHLAGEIMHIEDVYLLPENDAVSEILEPQNVKSLIVIPMIKETK